MNEIGFTDAQMDFLWALHQLYLKNRKAYTVSEIMLAMPDGSAIGIGSVRDIAEELHAAGYVIAPEERLANNPGAKPVPAYRITPFDLGKIRDGLVGLFEKYACFFRD